MRNMAKFSSKSAAEGYKQASLSVQKVDGEMFVQTDVCPQAGDAILDLGCGTGELSAYLAGLVGPEGNVVGVDPDKERIQLARQSYREIKNLTFIEGNASNFPDFVNSKSFDIIFSNYVLHWIPDKQQAFNNMFESLNVGGKIAISFITRQPSFEFNCYKELNPENAENICKMMHYEARATIVQYCCLAGFEIIRSYKAQSIERIFESVESLLEFHWSTTHGVFDPSLVTEERLKRLVNCSKDETPCVDFQETKEVSPVCRLIAVKKAKCIPSSHQLHM